MISRPASLACLFMLGFSAPAQENAASSTTVIRAETRLVLVDAVVRDHGGKLVHDLGAKDFRLWEDGREQPITSFSTETAAAAPDRSRRSYLTLFFDNTSLSVTQQIMARKDAARFASSWAASDRYMAVVNFGGSLSIAQNFTALPEPLVRAIDAVQTVLPTDGAMPTEETTRLDTLADRQSPSRPQPNRGQAVVITPEQSPDAGFAQQGLLEALHMVADSLASVRGRKGLVLFGRDFTNLSAFSVQIAGVIAACNRANVAVYVTSPALKMLSDETGGRAIANANDLVTGLGRIAEEQEERYVLGYVPEASPEGSCHALRVAVNRRGLDVRARKEYCASKPVNLLAGKPPEAVPSRPAAPPAGNFAASLQLPWFYTSANVARVNVAVEIPPAAIPLTKVKGKHHAEVSVTGAAYRAQGDMAGGFSDAIKLDFAGDKEAAAFAKSPYHYEYQFDLPAGSYDFRVSFQSAGAPLGEVRGPLAIDAWDGRSLAISGVAFSREARPVPDLASSLDDSLLEDRRPLIASGMQFRPAGGNRFRRGTPVFAYFEICDPALAGARPSIPAVRFRIVDSRTGAPVAGPLALAAADFIRQGNPVAAVAINLPIASLSPGPYRIEITAQRSPTSQPIIRTADFEIDP